MERRHRLRSHVPALAGLLSAISLALVFSAVLGYVPNALIPEAPTWVVAAIPHVNAAISATAFASIVAGWYWIRAGDVANHRIAMLAATGLFAGFLVLYLYRLILLGGPTAFGGPDSIYRFVYLPLLAVHVLLAIVCIPLLYYVLLLAYTHPVRELAGTRHARVGRVAASLWLVSFALGVIVYVLLHQVY